MLSSLRRLGSSGVAEQRVKACAEEVCAGRYIVITHAGYRQDLAEYIFPRIVDILSRP